MPARRSQFSIRNIALATMRRKAHGTFHASAFPDAWAQAWKEIVNRTFPFEADELPLFMTYADEETWTVLTTKRLFGQKSGDPRSILLDAGVRVGFPLPKTSKPTISEMVVMQGDDRTWLPIASHADGIAMRYGINYVIGQYTTEVPSTT